MAKGTKALLAVAIFALLGAGVALFAVINGSGSTEEAGDIVYGVDEDALPSSSLTDWVSYATQISRVTVMSEAELPSELSEERGGGYVGRSVALRINETLWNYPNTVPQTGTVSFVANGWIRKDGVTLPYGSLGAERLEVGKSYVLPLVRYGDEWGWLSASTILPLDSNQVVELDPQQITNPASQLLHGKNANELTQTLNNTQGDTNAAQFAHLPAVERFDAATSQSVTNVDG